MQLTNAIRRSEKRGGGGRETTRRPWHASIPAARSTARTPALPGAGGRRLPHPGLRSSVEMVGIVFEGIGQVAVFDRDLLGQGEVRFLHNSWRGDQFEPMLRAAIQQHNEVRDEEWAAKTQSASPVEPAD